jgi:hypothetical protein
MLDGWKARELRHGSRLPARNKVELAAPSAEELKRATDLVSGTRGSTRSLNRASKFGLLGAGA